MDFKKLELMKLGYRKGEIEGVLGTRSVAFIVN